MESKEDTVKVIVSVASLIAVMIVLSLTGQNKRWDISQKPELIVHGAGHNTVQMRIPASQAFLTFTTTWSALKTNKHLVLQPSQHSQQTRKLKTRCLSDNCQLVTASLLKAKNTSYTYVFKKTSPSTYDFALAVQRTTPSQDLHLTANR